MVIRIFFLMLVITGSCFSQNVIYRMKVDGVINPASAEFIQSGIDKANNNAAQCLIIEMDTPGGLMKSMNIIIKSILNSDVPVVVYVSPSGSHCASAGVFIMMSAHVAVMAPGTNIGAAHPVNMGGGGQDSSSQVMMEKVTNDAVSYIRSLAAKNKRNADWAEDAVRKSVSITELKAAELNVIDMIAKNFDSLLVQINNLEIETVTGKKTIHTDNSIVETIERSWRLEFLDILSDPNLAYILMMLGIYGLFFELYNPGSVVPGVIGGICLILAFYSFQTLPINYAGIALIILAIILFLLEIKITSYGVLSIGGAVSLFLGSVMLFDSTEDMLTLSYSVIIPVVIITLLFFGFIIGYGLKAQSRKITTGSESMAGKTGTALETFNSSGRGKILVHGEIWSAESQEQVMKDDKIVVEKMVNFILVVRKI